jgi:hypothetical protein
MKNAKFYLKLFIIIIGYIGMILFCALSLTSCTTYKQGTKPAYTHKYIECAKF